MILSWSQLLVRSMIITIDSRYVDGKIGTTEDQTRVSRDQNTVNTLEACIIRGDYAAART